MKILIVEDEAALSASMTTYLANSGFVCECADHYQVASQKIHDYNYDAVIVDIMLPDGSGLDLVQELKASQPEAGILIISARNALQDKVSGLDMGADDYLTKPFHLAELSSRLKSIIRRRKFSGQNEITFEQIRVLPESAEVYVAGNRVRLTRKEFDLLLFFLANRNQVVSKAAIAEHLWGDDIDMVDSFDFIFSHIKNLRKKLVASGADDYIQTVYGRGYRFSPK